jgi:thiamine pyrophosphate-dependent acetolactate synthase large subunit-like protein
MNGPEVFASALVNEGVKQIFRVPGKEKLVLVEATCRPNAEHYDYWPKP